MGKASNKLATVGSLTEKGYCTCPVIHLKLLRHKLDRYPGDSQVRLAIKVTYAQQQIQTNLHDDGSLAMTSLICMTYGLNSHQPHGADEAMES